MPSVPTDYEVRARLKTILESLVIPAPTELDPTATETTKAVVFDSWVESFDEGENIDALRSALDTYDEVPDPDTPDVTIQRERVNAWMMTEGAFAQSKNPKKDSRGMVVAGAGGKNIITRTYRLFYFYQFGGDGARRVSLVIEAARVAFNNLPKLGFATEIAEFVDGHDGLQMPFEDEGDFKGVIAYVRGGMLTVRFIEPLETV